MYAASGGGQLQDWGLQGVYERQGVPHRVRKAELQRVFQRGALQAVLGPDAPDQSSSAILG